MSDVASQPRVLVRWQLGHELAQMRKHAALKQDDVSKHLDWNPAKISRIENGDLGIQTNDLRAMLDLYGHNDPDDRNRLEEMARVSRSRFKRSGDEHLLRGRYLTYEDAATSMTCWEPYVVPGLLQVEGYLRSRIQAVHTSADDDEIERRVNLRLARQDRLVSHQAPDFSAVLDEAVLIHQIGGSEVMRDQLRHLIDIAQRRNITIQVLPAKHAAHPFVSGSATHMAFKGHTLELVYFEGNPNDFVETEPESVRRYRNVLTTIRALALDPDSSAERIEQALIEIHLS